MATGDAENRPSIASTEPGGAHAPDVSILIVAYNSADFIEECITAIAAGCRQHAYEVLMVDNGDGSTERLVRREFPDVRIIASKGNVGFAAGNNMLANLARSSFILLLNPDMVISPGAIDALLGASRTYPAAAAWGGVSLGKDGKPDTGNALSVPNLYELLTVSLGRSGVGSRPVPGLTRDATAEVLMGGLVMLSKSAWDQVGGLDERFFLYCEEVDLFYRLRRAGYIIWRIAGATGVHDAAHGNGFSPRRQLYRTTGIMEFARHHWSAPRVWLAALLIWQAAVARLLVGRLVGKSNPRLRMLGASNQIVARYPSLWFYGYDPQKGLLAKMAKTKLPGL